MDGNTSVKYLQKYIKQKDYKGKDYSMCTLELEIKEIEYVWE